MNIDWMTTVIPIINAMGIPLLAVGIVLLLRAYQKSVEAYKDTTEHLKGENERLRTQLLKLDSGYVDTLEKMRVVVSKSIQATGELQAAKISLLTNPGNVPKEEIQSDIEKIDDAISLLKELSGRVIELESYLKERDSRIQMDFARLSHEMMVEIGNLLPQIGDTQSRLSIARVISSEDSFESLSSEIEKNKRGLFFLPEHKKLPMSDSEILKLMEELKAKIEPEEDERDSDSTPELSAGLKIEDDSDE